MGGVFGRRVWEACLGGVLWTCSWMGSESNCWSNQGQSRAIKGTHLQLDGQRVELLEQRGAKPGGWRHFVEARLIGAASLHGEGGKTRWGYGAREVKGQDEGGANSGENVDRRSREG